MTAAAVPAPTRRPRGRPGRRRVGSLILVAIAVLAVIATDSASLKMASGQLTRNLPHFDCRTLARAGAYWLAFLAAIPPFSAR